MIYFLLIPLILISLVSLSIALYNLISRPVLHYRSMTGMTQKPLVSVLIPAHNQAKTIERILYIVTQQTYRNIEIVVLDDCSDDRTVEIANSVAHVEPRLRVIKGKPCPRNWIRKNWTFHQLALEAKGEMLLFIEPNVLLGPEAISSAVSELTEKRAAMLSVYPTQIMQSFGERLIVPLMNWVLLSFLPLRLVLDSSDLKFTAANGQFILITRDAYRAIGGHAAIKNKIAGDMEIARELKRANIRIIALLGGDLVSCRMYDGAGEAVAGFTRVFFAGYNIPKPYFILMLSILGVVYLGPFIAIIENSLFIFPIVVIILNRLIVSVLSQQSFVLNVLLHPVHMIIIVILGIRSVEEHARSL